MALPGSSSRALESCRFLTGFCLLAIGATGCAGLVSGNSQPVCRPDSEVLGPLQKIENQEACRNEEIQRESDELEARVQAEVAEANAQRELDEQIKKQEVAEATAAYEAQRQATARAQRAAEAEEFQSALVTAAYLHTACKDGDLPRDDFGKVVSTRAYLLAFESSADRDSALGGLEPCRGEIEKGTRAYLPGWLAEKREAFARQVEDDFDGANPVRRGDLKAKVSGRTLKVRLPGGFEGRARHSKTQLELMCERSGAEMFSRITLVATSHGTFSCEPAGAMKDADILRSLLAQLGADEPWTDPPSGSKPTPTAPPDDASGRVDPFGSKGQ